MPHRSRIGRPGARAALLVALGASFLGCASRRVPGSFPPSSAASDRAGEAPPAVVTASLDAEPPLPGDATDRSAPAHHGGAHHGP